jgi:hypothetical protein
LWKRNRTKNRDEEIHKIGAEPDELLHREEMMWRQRARVLWLNEGDINTKFFHRKANWRQAKNKINKIRDTSGNWTDDL